MSTPTAPITPPADQERLSATDPDTNFERIALALSGGGFRAAAYHLGTLNALYTLGLLDHVQMISTVSGGSIIGAYYALQRHRGVPFPEIFTQFEALLTDDKLLSDALKAWETAIASGKSGYKLIQAFASVYDGPTMFDGATFGVFWEQSAQPMPQTIVFNATELYSGLAFRFQHVAGLPDNGYRIGNGNVYITADEARKLRLADVVAASSCFPGGFEPLVLPDDFPRPKGDLLFYAQNQDRLDLPRLALLDGGIYDNQGTESLLRANERNASYLKTDNIPATDPRYDALQPITMLLISDVSSADVKLYDAPGPGPVAAPADAIRALPARVDTWFRWSLIVAGCAFGYYLIHLFGLRWVPFEGFLLGMVAGAALTVGFGVQLAVRWLFGKLDKMGKAYEPIYSQATGPLYGLSLKQLVHLLTIRFSSVMVLLDAIFLRRIRSQGYTVASASDGIVRVSSVLDRLTRALKDPETPIAWKRKLQAVQPIVEQARAMGTTLWWLDDSFRIKSLIASGELTLCYRLLRLFEQDPPPPGSKAAEVQRRAQALWDSHQNARPAH